MYTVDLYGRVRRAHFVEGMSIRQVARMFDLHRSTVNLERLWRTVKYEEVYLKAYSNGRDARAGLDAYFSFYNNQRPHQALDYRTPAEVHSASSDEPSKERGWTPNGASADLGNTAGLSLNFAPNLSN